MFFYQDFTGASKNWEIFSNFRGLLRMSEIWMSFFDKCFGDCFDVFSGFLLDFCRVFDNFFSKFWVSFFGKLFSDFLMRGLGCFYSGSVCAKQLTASLSFSQCILTCYHAKPILSMSCQLQ